MEYNYIENVKEDVKTAILEHFTKEEIKNAFKSLEARDELYTKVYDALYVDDNVTGNSAEFYTYDNDEAEEYLCHNIRLLGEALDYFKEEENCANALLKGACYCDVVIRNYLLGSAIKEALEEL